MAPKEHAPETFLITEAQTSLEEQHRARVRKYLTLMAFRVPALVLAGIIYGATQNGFLALGVIILSIPIPWVAVLIANDRPPRAKGEVPHYKYGTERTNQLTEKRSFFGLDRREE
ncbi:DUF3099 domain-containing protein [Williamsia soli]|uniref:DUF3099 domain-containing protein n=1 Tax=Williamsia soli TaxID=364929 RepID=UPI001A9DD015|nr:DUF3099 domain-containing protein [Williamsia soli]